MLGPRRDPRREGAADLPSWELSLLVKSAVGLQLTVLFLTVLFAAALWLRGPQRKQVVHNPKPGSRAP